MALVSCCFACDCCHLALATHCVVRSLDIQYRLLEQTWPKQVLALNACKVIRGEAWAWSWCSR